jgi:hypothetical protein
MLSGLKSLYKGVGPGTYWHKNHTSVLSGGFTTAAAAPGVASIIRHIVNFSRSSAYLSLSTSFAVARSYALDGPGGLATPLAPGYVFEFDLALMKNLKVNTVEPAKELVRNNGDLWHDGDQRLLVGIATNSRRILTKPVPRPGAAAARPPSFRTDLEAVVRALRDAEVLVHGNLPHQAIGFVHSVW